MFELRFVPPDLRRIDELSAEVVTCGVFRDERPLTGLAGLLDWRLAGRLSKLAKEGFLLGEVGEVLAAPARPRLPFDKVLALGLGPKSAFGDVTFRQVLERTMTALSGLPVKKAVIELPGRAAPGIGPDKVAEILLDVIGDDERDGLCFVEDAESARQIEKHARDRRRGASARAL